MYYILNIFIRVIIYYILQLYHIYYILQLHDTILYIIII